MKVSRRAKRMQRHYTRMHRAGGLNLVSLMDIFTILVFFLMVNSSDVKVLQQNSKVKLPQSTAEAPAIEQLVVTVSGRQIIVQGRAVASLDDNPNGDLLPGLQQELNYQTSRQAEPSLNDSLSLTLLADKMTPYKDLKRVMATCTEAGYANVSLAVERQISEKEG